MLVHHGGVVVDDRLDLLAVDEFGDGCAAVATSREICSIGMPLTDSKQRHEAARAVVQDLSIMVWWSDFGRWPPRRCRWPCLSH